MVDYGYRSFVSDEQTLDAGKPPVEELEIACSSAVTDKLIVRPGITNLHRKTHFHLGNFEIDAQTTARV